jgi:hypothetical protein
VAPCYLRDHDFNIFVIISPLTRTWSFIWTILNPLYLRIICANFGYNWSSSSGEEVENVCLTDRRMMDNGRLVKLTWDFSSGELKNLPKYIHTQKKKKKNPKNPNQLSHREMTNVEKIIIIFQTRNSKDITVLYSLYLSK